MQESKPERTRKELYQEISYSKRRSTTDPKNWSIDLEHPSENTTEYCWICSLAEDIARARKGIGTTGLGQVCYCQWKERV